MRTVVLGAGEVGFNTARMLSREGHQVILVEQDERLVERVSEQLDALVVQGNGASPRVLSEAGIDEADLLVAATNSDEANIIGCLLAKTQGVELTVARLHNPDYYDPEEPFAQETLGIDFVIHTEQMAAKAIRTALLVPGAVNVDTFAGDRVAAAEVVLEKGSPVAGRALRDVRLPGQTLIVGVVREGEALVPRGDTVLKERDHVLVVTARRLSEAVRAVGADTAPVREVVIYGGGRIGLRLALALEEAGMGVKVIERDERRARYVAAQLRKGFVLHADALSEDFLMQERVGEADAFVAVTRDDRANLLAAMYARRLGARRTIAGISQGEFAPLADALGVDLTISPRLLAAEAILRFVRRGEIVNVALLESGAEMIELRVPQGCRVAGRPLAEVDFPEGAIIGAVIRDGEVIIPTGQDALEPGDDVIVFAVEGAVERVERLFAP
ncbi:TrkA-N [Rubrobacter xylanophilus DSM 9941]|uniref:Trk system potassium uptake protein TrkA n=1 Tax=Rubrobacter xylanophilus (strain DSM 9941 / JCM 11954 / NBRC 16129 / PRD-1) TaxID=266117 RepID=Q1AWJ2_RUBXD|nr:Trk system potassium transporter TrkA [Rubrobacter xylanophilus]ABG04236.1 TrkA-N [Rubrobacter xylanophilus DSM 9941]